MKKALEQVTEFHRAFGHPIALDPMPKATPTVEEMAKARQSWIVEERSEIAEAFADNSLKDLADGLVDFRYFILGNAVAFGTPIDDGSAQRVSADLLSEVVFAMSSAYVLSADRVLAQKRAIVQAEIIVQGVAALYGIPLEAAFTYVHEQGNMAKLGPDGKPNLNPETGKVIKPEGWTAPDLGGMLGEGGIEPGVPVAVRLVPRWMTVDAYAMSGVNVLLNVKAGDATSAWVGRYDASFVDPWEIGVDMLTKEAVVGYYPLPV